MERILGIASVVPVNTDKPRSYRITLVEEVAERLGIKKGDKVVYSLDEELDRIFIRKA